MAGSSSSLPSSGEANPYPYPSHVFVPNFVTVKLNDRDTYDVWQMQMMCLLESHDMLGFISSQSHALGKEKVGDDDMMWRRSDALVKGWIFGSLSQQTLKYFVKPISNKDLTAKDVWDKLLSLYGPPVQDDDDDEDEEAELQNSNIDLTLKNPFESPAHAHLSLSSIRCTCSNNSSQSSNSFISTALVGILFQFQTNSILPSLLINRSLIEHALHLSSLKMSGNKMFRPTAVVASTSFCKLLGKEFSGSSSSSTIGCSTGLLYATPNLNISSECSSFVA
ncbi:hypothetical protein E3N88_09621 [Mikania micrantha]|uniref:Retrotransposon Copia-like N-terminal domain-containing protein n=1 Tax=Mikania micrantha TaxID=192012 RepID=A0A5N6PMN9_9ASTR|nr:hypothetical protein E3N88_09621 [Mikania micrantha]